jgi:hypothetical protein
MISLLISFDTSLSSPKLLRVYTEQFWSPISIKKEENRKKFANVDKASDNEFKTEYEDRMTDATELEEDTVLADDAFNLDFDDYNVFGEKLTESKELLCCICGEPIDGYGNNPEPYKPASSGKCCDGCNIKFVIPIRLDQARRD